MGGSLDTVLSRVNDLKESIKKFQEETKKKNETFFKDAVKFLFDEYPVLENFSWNQYTPYFNDGDECVFSVNRYSFAINDGIEEYDLKSTQKVDIGKLNTKYADLSLQKQKAVQDENYSHADLLKREMESVKKQIDDYKEPGEQKQLAEAFKAAEQVFNAFDDEALRALFDDHVQVTVSREGIEVESYQHD